MRALSYVVCLTAAAAAVVCSADVSRHHQLLRRQASLSHQSQISNTGKSDPVSAADAVLKIPNIGNKHEPYWFPTDNVTGDGDEGQVPWSKGAKYTPNPWSLGSYVSGYLYLPEEFGLFKLNRTFAVRTKKGETATLPFYVNKHYDASKIKRVVVIWPGQWRDVWRYANMLGNAFEIAQQYKELGVSAHETLLVAPALMNQKDRRIGAVKGTDMSFKDSGWSTGGVSHAPKGFTGVSTFAVMDTFFDMFMDKRQFPNVDTAVMVGHSLGAQATQRYALLAKKKSYESKMKYWIGNPGAWVWTAPGYTNHTKKLSPTSFGWPFGFANKSSIPSFARDRVGDAGERAISLFRSRRIKVALGLNDNGSGSGQPEAKAEGPNRLYRSAGWILSMGFSKQGWSKTHSVDFVPGVSHQDYPMIAYYGTLKYVFSEK